MPNKPELFTIPKPESSKYLQDIENILAEDGFIINNIYEINNWEETGRAIYKAQLDIGTEEFKKAFEGHIRVSQILFGNESVLITLQNPYNDLSEGLKELYKKKQGIRHTLGARGHNNLLICANLEAFPEDIFSNYGLRGTLGVNRKDEFYSFGDYIGVWDYFYFKFLHTSDPEIDILIREWNILTELGILNYQIDKNKWKIMKSLKTLITPKDDNLGANIQKRN